MNREMLEKPFGMEEIKKRKGNFGKTLDYIEGHAVIQRLNDAFDAEWSFRILEHKVFKEEDEVLVLGELKSGDITKTQFGSSKITRAKETGEIISLADDLKAAATDSLKKAATLLGIGLQLYNGGSSRTSTPPANRHGKCDMGFEPVEGTANVYKPKFTATRGEETDPSTGNNGNETRLRHITTKQFSYIQSLGKKRFGYSLQDLSDKCIQIYGVELDRLSTSEASSFIHSLESGEICSAAV